MQCLCLPVPRRCLFPKGLPMDVYSIGTKVIKAHYISSLWCFISFIIGVRSVCNPCAPAFTFPSFKRFPAPGAQSMAMQCEVEQPEIPPLLEVCPKKETRPPPPTIHWTPRGPQPCPPLPMAPATAHPTATWTTTAWAGPSAAPASPTTPSPPPRGVGRGL